MGRDLTPFILQATTPAADGTLVLDRPAVCAEIVIRSSELTEGTVAEKLVDWIVMVYDVVLSRPPSGGEQSAAVNAVLAALAIDQAHAISIAGEIISNLFLGGEYTGLAHSNDLFVDECYLAFLERPSDVPGHTYWVNNTVSNGRAATLYAFTLDGNFATDMKRYLMLSESVTLQLATRELTATSVSTLAVVAGEVVAVSAPAFRQYAARIKSVDDIKFSKGKAPEGGGLTLTNLDYAYTEIIGNTVNAFDGAEVTLFLALRKSDGTYEIEQLLHGIITDPQGDLSECTLGVLSDMSVRSAMVADRELTQHCIFEFGGPGCMHTAHAPGDTCSKIYDDIEGGCAFWRWQFAFGGAPNSISSDPSFTTASADLDPTVHGGWDGDGYPRLPHKLDPDFRPFMELAR